MGSLSRTLTVCNVCLCWGVGEKMVKTLFELARDKRYREPLVQPYLPHTSYSPPCLPDLDNPPLCLCLCLCFCVCCLCLCLCLWLWCLGAWV